MPQQLAYGQITFPAYSRQELDTLGYSINPNMWLGDGWFFCKVCRQDTPHYAMSNSARLDCVEVCRHCDNYSGRNNP